MDKLKTDSYLGEQVEKYLKSIGLETPMILHPPGTMDEREKIKRITKSFGEIMYTLGLDLSDDSLNDTPSRVAKMFVREIFYGLNYENFPKCTTIENKMARSGSFVLERDINVQSNCEHHFVVIDGKAAVAYIPDKVVLGLSKLNRIVEFFSKRPQVQERLTEQVRAAIQFITKTDDVAVYIDAVHYCVKSRGVQDANSRTITFSAGGVFQDFNSDIRREFLNLARSK